MFPPVSGKKNAIAIENGGFEGATTAPWTIEKQGECTVQPVPDSGGKALEWTLGKSFSDGSMGVVTHPALMRLRCKPGQTYRLSFSVRGTAGNHVIKHPQVQAPLVVRIIYSEEKPGAKPEYRYEWLSFHPNETKHTEHILIVSPDANRWQFAGVTFFLWQAGTYRLDDVLLESWE